jgi:YVTN family beta-propeller protein
MRFGRWQCLIAMAALAGTMSLSTAQAGPLAVVANFTDPGITQGPPWPAGSVNVIDTATDKEVARFSVGANPMAVAITPDGKTAVVACAQSSELYFIDLSGAKPAMLGKLSVGSGSGDTFYPAGLTISPDGQYVAVTSTVGGQQRSTFIKDILLVDINERSLVQTLDVQAEQAPLTAEAAAFTPRGSLLVVGPSAQPPVIYALRWEGAQIAAPEVDEETQKNSLGGLQNSTGFNVTVAPDGSFALVPLGRSAEGKSGLAVLKIGALGKIMDESVTPIDSGGDGPHSAAITTDGKLAYVRNFLPPNNNIAVFEIQPGPSLKDTGLRLNAEGLPSVVLELPDVLPGALAYVGSQMVAVTPDGKKIYAPNPFGGRPDPALFGLYGVGNVLVFEAGKAEPVKRLEFGKNPIAIAIQPQ